MATRMIGTNAAMFGLVQRLMLAAPPGVQDAARVVRVGLSFTSEDGGQFTITSTSYPVFRALAALGGAFRGVALRRYQSKNEQARQDRLEKYFPTLH